MTAQPQSRVLTTVTLPEAGEDPRYPWRYLFGYSHRTGYGVYVSNCDEPIATGDHVLNMLRAIERDNVATYGAAIIATTLIAAPAGTLTMQVPISDNPTHPWRYLIGYRFGAGYGTQVLDCNAQISTMNAVTAVDAQIRQLNRAKVSGRIAILSLHLLAGPRT